MLAAFLVAPAAAELTIPELSAPAFRECELHGSGGRGRVAAQCARFTVPENPQDPGGDTIELFVARIPALSPEPAADALTVINGGPGGSSVSLYVDLQHAFEPLRRERDIVVVDQRGTGRSTPLHCPSLQEASYELDIDAIRGATRRCLEELDRDPRFYTTSVAAVDLEALRRTLGYESLNLYGVSYGTRVAQHYLQRFPDAVRTLIIDGVLPGDLALGPDIAVNAQASLEAILERCRTYDYCAHTFPELDRQLREVTDRLQHQPVSVEVPHPTTGRRQPVKVHYAQLAMSLRMLSYAPETAALIPLIIQEAAARQNYLPLASQALLIEKSLLTSLSFGMHNSVVCTEDVPFYGNLDSVLPELEATYLGDDQVRTLALICELWPRGVLHPSLREPVESSKPVLLLSGELDPITPPSYAERAAAAYPNSRNLVAAGQGHGVVGRGCLPELVNDFVQAGSLEDLDASCLDRLRYDAFFVDLLGPPP